MNIYNLSWNREKWIARLAMIIYIIGAFATFSLYMISGIGETTQNNSWKIYILSSIIATLMVPIGSYIYYHYGKYDGFIASRISTKTQLITGIIILLTSFIGLFIYSLPMIFVLIAALTPSLRTATIPQPTI